MSDLSSSSTIKASFDHKTLCICKHRRMDHKLMSRYVGPEEEAESSVKRPNILCDCGCVTFKLMTNLEYLEILVKEKDDGLLDS